MEQQLFIDQITKLSDAFRCDIPKERSLQIYWKYLQKISNDDFKNICKKIIEEEKFFPAISVFLKIEISVSDNCDLPEIK